MNKSFSLLLAVPLSLPLQSRADSNGQYVIYTDAMTCAYYLEAEQIDSRTRLRAGEPEANLSYINQLSQARWWINGWLTAANSLTPKTLDVARGNYKGVYAYVHKYCSDHPTNLVPQAMDAFLAEEHPQRTK